MKLVVQTASAPKAVGPYSQAIVSGDLLFTSGQLGMDPQTGKLADGAQAQARRAMENLGAVLAAQGLSYDHIVKSTIFLTDLTCFSVVNEVYRSFFTGEYPARSCVQVAALPLGASVEIECVAVR
jgi:2-iminobutanoate/2-iminopropanoate deaminase